MIRLRIDVDYAYPSRLKSYLSMMIDLPKFDDYLENCCVMAKMINDSLKEVVAYWFFTYQTLPDEKLLKMLDSKRHVVGLHVVNNPFQELNALQKVVDREIEYYTVHGTENYLAQKLWHRPIGITQLKIPISFGLKSFHDFSTYSLDMSSTSDCMKHSDRVLSLHPDWLFKRNKIGRGPNYNKLLQILHDPCLTS